MNIKIKETLTSELIQSYKVKFDLQMKYSYTRIVIPCVAGIFFIISNLHDKEGIIIGSSLIFLSAIYFYSIFNARKSYIDIAKKTISKLQQNEREVIFELNDTSFKCETFEAKVECKWSAFSNYKLVDGILYLLLNDNYLSSFGINENILTREQLLEFYTFLKSTLSEKK